VRRAVAGHVAVSRQALDEPQLVALEGTHAAQDQASPRP
jgi:hypothetical protein